MDYYILSNIERHLTILALTSQRNKFYTTYCKLCTRMLQGGIYKILGGSLFIGFCYKFCLCNDIYLYDDMTHIPQSAAEISAVNSQN